MLAQVEVEDVFDRDERDHVKKLPTVRVLELLARERVLKKESIGFSQQCGKGFSETRLSNVTQSKRRFISVL